MPDFFPQTVSYLVFFRIIGGLGIGVASMNAPMYIAEIAPPEKRGYLVTYYQLAIVVGFFIVFLATYFIGNSLNQQQNIDYGWRRMFWSELLPSSLFLILLFFVPKSPRWLIMKGDNQEAKNVLSKIIPADQLDNEVSIIEKSIKSEISNEKVSFKSKSVLIVVLIGAVLSGLQQFTGINAVLYYGADIFEKALGYGEEDVLKQQVLLAFVNLIFTFIAMFTVDKLGRKPLIYIGCLGMAFGFILLSTL